MFLERLDRLARGNGMGLESALRDLCERRHLTCAQIAKDLRVQRRDVHFWADAYGVRTEDIPPKIVQAARAKPGKKPLRDYFLRNFGRGVGWMADDLGVAFTTVEEWYAVFSGGEAWRIGNGRGDSGKASR